MNLNKFNILYAMKTTDNEVFNSFEEWDADFDDCKHVSQKISFSLLNLFHKVCIILSIYLSIKLQKMTTFVYCLYTHMSQNNMTTCLIC